MTDTLLSFLSALVGLQDLPEVEARSRDSISIIYHSLLEPN